MNFEAAALAYVRYVLEMMELKPGALAKKAGISPSTLTRALHDPDHKFKLSTTTLEKIAEFSGFNPAPFLEARDSAEMTLNEAFRNDLYRPRPNVPTIEDKGPDRKYTMLVGEVAANVWRSPEPFPYFDYGPLHLTSSNRLPKDCFAFVVRDESANLLATPGDILFCTRPDEENFRRINNQADPGMRSSHSGLVLVERRSKDEFKVEHTLRFIRADKDLKGWELISAKREDYAELDDKSGGKKRRRQIPTVRLADCSGDDEYRIIGEVQEVIRDNITEINWLLFNAPS